MTTHVEKALPEPSAEPQTAQSPPGKSAQGAEMLSPVSKLELARKYAAEEQQRRVEKACERMVEVKKAQIVKELEFETHVETRVEQHVVEGESKQSGGRLSSIAMRIVSAFKSTTQETSTAAEEDEAASPTRKLLQATRNKLNALASNGEVDADLPATNYHLKQLGLANEKINIYAPIQEQQNEIRRRRESAIRCQEKYMHENAEYPGDEGYKSGEDSDFAPEEDEDEDADAESDSDDDEDDDSDVEIDAEEVRQLLADQSEFARSVKTLKKHAKRTKKTKASKSLVPTSPISILGAFLALLLALALAIFFAEQQSGFCTALVAQTPRAEEPRIVTCNVVLRVEAFFLSILRALPFQSSA